MVRPGAMTLRSFCRANFRFSSIWSVDDKRDHIAFVTISPIHRVTAIQLALKRHLHGVRKKEFLKSFCILLSFLYPLENIPKDRAIRSTWQCLWKSSTTEKVTASEPRAYGSHCSARKHMQKLVLPYQSHVNPIDCSELCLSSCKTYRIQYLLLKKHILLLPSSRKVFPLEYTVMKGLNCMHYQETPLWLFMFCKSEYSIQRFIASKH